MEYKMIISDMDGTLLENDNKLSEENISAINKAMDKGIVFAIATGRSFAGVKKHLKTLDIVGKEGYVICQNGGAIYRTADLSLYKKYNFPSTDIANIYEYTKQFNGIEYFFYDEMSLIVEKITDDVTNYCNIMNIEPICTSTPLDYKDGFTKIVIHGEHEDLLKVREELRSSDTSNLDCFFSNERYLEFVQKGVNKGLSMEFVAKELGFEISEVVAVGDSENDISMIAKAGLGAAMANSMDIVKDSADVVLENDNKNHGVAELILKHVL